MRRSIAQLFLFASLIFFAEHSHAQWFNNAWHYRVPVNVSANGFQRTDKPAEVTLNFTTLLGSGTFNENSVRVIEVNNLGVILDTNVVFQFDKAPDYNATTNALGVLVFMLNGTTASNATRYFHVYFDTAPGFTLPSFTSRVTLADNVFHEGQSSYQVDNQLGRLWYHKVGGGFSGMRDLNNTEWIGYTPCCQGAGEYRGIPNMGQYAHPGYSNGSSTVLKQGPIKVTIQTVTTDGTNARWTWGFYPRYQTMTLHQTAVNYWLLYEGIPYGMLDEVNGYVKNSSGQTLTLGSSFAADLSGPEWAYFGQTGQPRFLYLAHHEDDNIIDHYRPFPGPMTVFGFGRDGGSTYHYLSATGIRLTFGFGENESQAGQIMDNAFRDLSISVGPVLSSGFSLSSLNVTPGVTSAMISWTTNRPGTTFLEYGLTTSYGTIISDTTKQTQHAVSLSGLTATTLYHYRISSVDTGGNTLNTGDQTFTTRSPFTGSNIQTDNFNATPLNTSLWTIVNPLADATFGVNGSQFTIAVPGGMSHDVWTGGNFAPRIMQACNNVDFEIEVKFDSSVNTAYQLQGILVQQDSANFIRFDFTSQVSNTHVFAASFVNGTPTIRVNNSIGANGISPLYLRVARVGNTWTQSYSTNGISWTTAGSFSHTLTASAVGLFAGNAGASPAFTTHVDYFRNKATVGVNAKALLQGPYISGGDSMQTKIRSVMPLHHPYNVVPWNYSGNDSVATIPADVVDWVLMELRFATDAASKIGTRAAFLKKDGSIVDLDGTSQVAFNGVPAGNYYIIVRHRNHLSIMSATAIALSENSSLYDFSNSSSQTFGVASQIQVGAGRYALFAGDANASGAIQANDNTAVQAMLSQMGYTANDINLSGIVSTADMNVVLTNLTKTTQVP